MIPSKEIGNSQDEAESMERLIKEKTISYIIAAFGLTAGLAWNEAIKSLIEHVFPSSGNSLVAKILYAIALTIALVIISIYLAKLIKKEKSQN